MGNFDDLLEKYPDLNSGEEYFRNAIKKAKEALKSGTHDKETIEYIFPHLGESEDERIRKELLAWLKSKDGQILPIDRYNAAIAWLEKQGQVKEPTISQYEEDERIRETIIKILLCFDHYEGVTGKSMIAWVKKQGEQKPAEWSEIDKYKFDNICSFLQGHTKFSDSCKEDAVKFLQSLKDRVQPQPKQEWSEEDERCLTNAIYACKQMSDEDYDYSQGYIDAINWLKSLRPQNHWKPSEEQLDALQYVCRNINPPLSDKLGWDSLKTLKLMWQDIKKLKA